jgi:hypothetical protein
VTFTPLVVGAEGTMAAPSVAWSFCTAPKPLTEDNVVSTACLDAAALVPLGRGASIAATIPANACATFGPDTPPGGFRPRDPDVTGGYYQPLRADASGAPPAFELARVRCDLANASAQAASAFAAAYVPNASPHLAPLTAARDGAPVALDAIAAGARVVFEASWPVADAETYAYFDPGSQTVTTKRESMQVAWYATDGAFDTESTGRAEDDLATASADAWVAPTAPGKVHLWVILRDSRGGVDFAGYDVTVR